MERDMEKILSRDETLALGEPTNGYAMRQDLAARDLPHHHKARVNLCQQPKLRQTLDSAYALAARPVHPT
jgi:hypothetical protein